MTRVTVYPTTYLKNPLKIIDIADSLESNLFTAPVLPGSYGMMRIEMYSNDLLVETQSVNITTVLGN